MMNTQQLHDFLNQTRELEGPKLSLHLKTHRAYPDNQADPIQYKNAVQDLQRQLAEGPHARRLWEPAIKRMEQLYDDQNFWNHTPEGIVVLAAGDHMQVFPLEYSVRSMHRVGSHFHLLPLFHLDDTLGYVYVVDLSRDRFSMYLVNPLGMSQVNTPQIKQSFPELFDDFDANANLRVGGFGGKDGMHYGHRARPEEMQKDRDKYFRYLADSFARLHKDTGMHFILAGTTDTIAHFRQVATGDKYLDGTIDKPLDAMDEKAVVKEVTDIMRPLEQRELAQWTTQISNQKAAGKVSHNLGDMLKAAKEGRVERLFFSDELKEEQLEPIAAIVEHALAAGATILVTQAKDRLLDMDSTAVLRY